MSLFHCNSLIHKIISAFPKKHAIILKEGDTVKYGDAYNAIDVARHIIHTYDTPEYKGYMLSNLKLQKLLYLIQALFLLKKNEPCFKDEIVAWSFGPVVPSVYHSFKVYGASPIASYESYDPFDPLDPEETKHAGFHERLKEEDIILIDSVLKSFKDWSAIDLMNLSHNQRPWMDAYNNGKGKNTIISKESIEKYFTEKNKAKNGK